MSDSHPTEPAGETSTERPSSWRRFTSHHAPGRRRAGRTWAIAAGLVLLPALALTGCGDDDDDSGATDSGDTSATIVNATEADGTIKLDVDSSATGNVEFAIKNVGALTHQFVVVKTDLAEDKLPIDAEKVVVDESAAGIEVIGEKESIAPNTDATLAFDDLASGKYVLICNVSGHYGLGMHVPFTVE